MIGSWFWNVLADNAVQQVQVKWFSDIAVETKPVIFLVNIAVATGGDHRQVGIFCFDAPASFQAPFPMQGVIQYHHMRPVFVNRGHKIFVEIHQGVDLEIVPFPARWSAFPKQPGRYPVQ